MNDTSPMSRSSIRFEVRHHEQMSVRRPFLGEDGPALGKKMDHIAR